MKPYLVTHKTNVDPDLYGSTFLNQLYLQVETNTLFNPWLSTFDHN